MKTKLLFALLLWALLLIFASCSSRMCIYEKDKTIKGERQKFTKVNSQCPSWQKYHKWLWIIPAKQK